VGLDVSSARIQIALLRPGSETITEDQVPNTAEAVSALVHRWGRPERIRSCYEAGPHGYELQRRLAGLGVDCQVIAPALIPVRPGQRVKTDRRDARNLCRLLRAGELTTVRVPEPEDEALRDLLRLREDLGEDILRARHRLSKFLLRHDRIWSGGDRWTDRHRIWIRAQRFGHADLDRALAEHLTAVDLRLAQRDALQREMLAAATRPRYAERVRRLCALRGISTLSALTLLVEVGDFRRFARAPAFMAFTGLVPTEHSSGSARRQGAITKSGNAHLRRILVEAAWSYRARPARTRERLKRLADQPPAVLAAALRAEEHLHRAYWSIVNRQKRTTVAAVAVARGLAGFVWAVMQEG
jgi:transposase